MPRKKIGMEVELVGRLSAGAGEGQGSGAKKAKKVATDSGHLFWFRLFAAAYAGLTEIFFGCVSGFLASLM